MSSLECMDTMQLEGTETKIQSKLSQHCMSAAPSRPKNKCFCSLASPHRYKIQSSSQQVSHLEEFGMALNSHRLYFPFLYLLSVLPLAQLV